ncbi:MAG TPA: SNF2-related protein, partial [Thermosynechococcaceae cyanobacterium]
QKILQLFSVIYEPVARTGFIACFNQLNIRDIHEEPVNASTLRSRLDNLLATNLLVQERGQSPQCNPLIVEILTREVIKAGRFDEYEKAVQTSLPVRSAWDKTGRSFSSQDQFIREVRIGIYRQDVKFINKQYEDYQKHSYIKNPIAISDVFQWVCNNPFDPEWFSTLSQELYEIALPSILFDSVLNCVPATGAVDLLNTECSRSEGRCSNLLRLVLTEQLLLRGQLQEAQQVLERTEDLDNATVFWGWLSFLQGDTEQAIEHYSHALKVLRKATGKRNAFFNTTAGLFFILALLKQGSASNLQAASDYADLIVRQPRHWLRATYFRLYQLLKFQQGDLTQKPAIENAPIASFPSGNSIETLFMALCLYWVDSDRAKKHLPRIIDPLYAHAKAAGYDWLAMETAELLARLKVRSNYGHEAKTWRERSGAINVVGLIEPQEAWELSLKALTNLYKQPQAVARPASSLRLAWFITFYSGGNYLLQPREQKINAKGGWSSGRPIALKRLKQTGELDYLTPQDLRVCAELEADYGSYYGKTEYRFGKRAIVALIGHPLVFWEDSPTIRVDVVKGEPELIVKQSKQERVTLQFSEAFKDNDEILVVKETPTRLKVIELKPEHRRIAEILGKQNRLEVPTSARERVLAAINSVAAIVTVHSDIGGGVVNAEEVPADSKPHVHLLPAGAGLKVAVLARPFANAGAYYRPGAGGETVIAEIDGKRLQTTRNLKEEKKLAKAAIAAVPMLNDSEEEDGEWLIEEPDRCLELLMQLQELNDSVVMEWPEGEKLRVSHRADMGAFKINIQQQRDWFAATGELKLDDDLVLDMQRLMELLEQTSSRFIPLGDGQFLALTQEFRKRLDELRTFSEKQGKGVRFNPLASLALEDFMDEVGDLKSDKHWKAHVQRLKEMKDLKPQVPSTLQAELRDYQIDGFTWLSRLAYWGVGACLADDMGLGKTLQALALILTRTAEGATLIVAPTSVCMNWISEAQKFAPTLNVIQFGGGDRQKQLDQLKPFDLLICSYGLLQQKEVAEMLAQVEWQTIVLDEAQAIKNTATQRSQAAMKLQGGFKLLTTGTPIENHLGELWNLFRFINPGLLGSLEQFNQNFAYPIERYQDKPARLKLKKLIQPFLLRRTKTQVLAELPSRTEILLQVELSQEEMAFYEALRREAIAKLSNSDATAGAK